MLLLAAPSLAKSPPTTPPVDRDYAAALATADHFLQAWQTRDPETGISLLTDRARQRILENALQDFFASKGHAPAGFEIGRGRKLGPARYRFPISLFCIPTSTHHRATRPQASSLIVVKTANEWAIDKLP